MAKKPLYPAIYSEPSDTTTGMELGGSDAGAAPNLSTDTDLNAEGAYPSAMSNATRPAASPDLSNPEDGAVGNVRGSSKAERDAKKPPKKKAIKKAKSPEMQKLHGQLMNWYETEKELQSWNRFQMAIDEDFYDGLQWSDEDAQVLRERGQAPTVFNQVKPAVNWLLGTERRTRADGVVLPRNDTDEESAEVKSKLLKYLSDVNRLPFARSKAWEDCVIAGVGWLEDRISTDPNDELLASGHESWRNIWYDSTSTELDINKDSRYLFRRRVLDLDYAITLCPEYANELRGESIDADQLQQEIQEEFYLGQRANAEASGDYGIPVRRAVNPFSASAAVQSKRQRVMLLECWYKVPENIQILRGGVDLDGDRYDPTDPDHQEAVESGDCFIVPHVRMQMRVAIMAPSFILYEAESPYRHNRFPLTPMWCYRRKRDNAPYGIIRDIRDAQEDYNKRASKAMFILATNQIIMEENAVEDIEETRQEAARPDGVIVKKKNAMLEFRQDKQLAEEHLHLMDRDKQLILDTSGVTNQNLGQDEHGLSGKAIGKLQDQGSVVNTPIFDNRLLALQIQSENQLSLIEQFYTLPKVVRIVGEKRPIEWLKVNQFDEGTGRWLNDITATKADYIIDEQDFKASTREAMFDSMMDLCTKLPPEVSLNLLDMVIDFADVPNKDEIVARIRKLNGQNDPSRKPTPEEQQQMAQAQQMQQAAQQLQMRTATATASKLEAEAQAKQAEVKRINAQALQANTTAFYEATQAGGVIGQQPTIAPVADAILQGAGFQNQAGDNPNLPEPAQAQPVLPGPAVPGPDVPQGLPAPSPSGAPAMSAGARAGIETPAVDGNTNQ